jgi:hypothetical protein
MTILKQNVNEQSIETKKKLKNFLFWEAWTKLEKCFQELVGKTIRNIQHQ